MDAVESQRLLRVHIGCEIVYELGASNPMLLAIQPAYNQGMVEEQRTLTPAVPVHEYIDGFGNQIWRLVAPIGTLAIGYHALVDVSPLPDLMLPDLPKTLVEELPDDVIIYTLPSRYCPSDLFIKDAWEFFSNIQGGWAQVQAVCDWLHTNVAYGAGSSTSTTTAWDAYQQRQGVCRDFAHLGVSFCRALNFPARYVCGYLPDINVTPDPSPMDFHAWFEVYMDNMWHTFDARHNRPRTGRVVIARGRDAVDVAFATIYGSAQLTSFTVWAEQVQENAHLGIILPEAK
ncbi:MAG: transglutaminase family protein [Anaerolineae bacterium]|nr:transglutaminase family protein [Anaerolineae bacterium]